MTRVGLDGNLTYSSDRTAERELFTAGARKKHPKWGPDEYPKKSINLSCVGGRVLSQRGAGAVFDDNYPIRTAVESG